jgi:predicted metalloprotease
MQVLASTEDTWAKLLQPNGIQYKPTKLHFYSEGDPQSRCGAAQSAMGPFYCPNDNSIYLDSEFFSELSQKYQAPGDFAEAYVIAHEVGHHVQDLTGTLGKAEQTVVPDSFTHGTSAQRMAALRTGFQSGDPAACQF